MEAYYFSQEQTIYKKISADMFLLFGVSEANYKTACNLEKLGYSWTIMLIHDEDVSRNYCENSTYKNRHNGSGAVCFELIKKTNRFVAQNEFQLSELKSFHKKTGILINTPIDLSNEKASTRAYILWVGRATDVKQPELFVALARLIPKESFVMVTSDQDRERFNNLINAAPANLEIHKNIPFHLIDGYFSRAKLLVNTSISEGFPVTFLHAGKYAVPVFTLGVDPNGILSEKGGGRVFDHLEDMKTHMDEKRLVEYGTRLNSLVRSLHDSQKIAGEILNYIQRY
jgi:glycosyltransferase involved in cell wall biosynthesis